MLTHNVAELVPYLAFGLFGIPLPLTPIQALSIDMATDSPTALGLGVEPPNPTAMRLPPRPQDERLLSGPLAFRAYLVLGVIEAAAAIAAYFFVLSQGGWHFGEALTASDPLYRSATAACLSAIIMMQIVNVFLCRSSVRSLFATGAGGNRLILWGAARELALLIAVNYAPLANVILDTAPVPPALWPLLAPFGVGMLALEEARKVRARFLCAGPCANMGRDCAELQRAAGPMRLSAVMPNNACSAILRLARPDVRVSLHAARSASALASRS